MINALACEKSEGVCADPNYHLSPADWSGGGSPWTQNGHWAGETDGGGQRPTPPTTLDTGHFRAQWALNQEGIHLYDHGARTVEAQGMNVRIGRRPGENLPIQICC